MFLDLQNDYHGSRVSFRIKSLPCTLSRTQVRRAKARLCFKRGCTCCGKTGIRGVQLFDGKSLTLSLNADNTVKVDYDKYFYTHGLISSRKTGGKNS